MTDWDRNFVTPKVLKQIIDYMIVQIMLLQLFVYCGMANRVDERNEALQLESCKEQFTEPSGTC